MLGDCPFAVVLSTTPAMLPAEQQDAVAVLLVFEKQHEDGAEELSSLLAQLGGLSIRRGGGEDASLERARRRMKDFDRELFRALFLDWRERKSRRMDFASSPDALTFREHTEKIRLLNAAVEEAQNGLETFQDQQKEFLVDADELAEQFQSTCFREFQEHVELHFAVMGSEDSDADGGRE